MRMDLLQHHFPNLSPKQIDQFERLQELYSDWNQKVNLISRKDIDNLYEKHVLHSLAIAKIQPFEPGSEILDVGTGGGFPGIPLAILFPECHFHLVDSIGKKIMVVNSIATSLGLQNVRAQQIRAEEIKQKKYDFVVSRAVSRLAVFYGWISNKFKAESNHKLKNGLLYLKGGDLTDEIKESRLKGVREYPLAKKFPTEFYETKKVVYVPFQ